jgi:hypothetical protein
MVDPSAGDLFRFAEEALETMRNAVSKAQCANIRGVFDNVPHGDSSAADVTAEAPSDSGNSDGH